MADREHEALLLGQADHLAGAVDLGVDGLLHEHVLALTEQRHHGVVVEGGRDGDREGFAAGHEVVEILKGKYQYYTCADMTKLRSAGFTGGRTPLAEAVADYVRGYLVPDRYLGDEDPA